MQIENITFLNSRGEELSGVLRIPQSYDKDVFPAIIVLHGYKENKDRDLIVAVADSLSHLGFVTLRFDFFGHGASQGDFSDFSLSRQIDDLLSAAKHLSTLDFVDKKIIGLIGHSFGGNVAMEFASEYPISSLVTIASRSSLEHFVNSHFRPEEVAELIEKGEKTLPDFRVIKSDFLVDFRKYDIPLSASKIRCPWLIIHGSDDKRAPYSESRELFYNKQDATLDIVDGADHTFSGEYRQYFLDTIGDWFKKTMK